MAVFPLSLPPPLDLAFGKKVLEEHPEMLEGDFLANLKEWMSERLTYRLDSGDRNEWVPPKQVLEEGSGNCEDIALLALSISEAAGHPGRIAFYYTPQNRTGHTVAFWRVSSCCGFNYRIIEGRAASIDPDDGLPVPEIMAWDATDIMALRKKFNHTLLEIPE